MSDRDCTAIHDDLAEYALGLLPAEESGPVAAHLDGCGQCRSEVEAFAGLGDRLLDLVPDVEAPLGFDRRVLTVVHQTGRRHWGRYVATGLAAAIIAVAVLVGAQTGHHPVNSESATLDAAGRPVGTVYVVARPEWVTMKVHGLSPASTTVSCQLVTRSGQVVAMGSFGLVNGWGEWSVPASVSLGDLAAVRLVDQTGAVVASARL